MAVTSLTDHKPRADEKPTAPRQKFVLVDKNFGETILVNESITKRSKVQQKDQTGNWDEDFKT